MTRAEVLANFQVIKDQVGVEVPFCWKCGARMDGEHGKKN